MPSTIRCNVAIVGAGLAGGLIALALAARHPGLDIRLIDAGPVVGGNHLWSFFDSDVAAADRWIVDPLISHRWTGYDVAFPRHARTIDANYQSIESSRLDAVVRERLSEGALMLGRKVLAASATAVVFADGCRMEADGVIDCRGTGDLSMLSLGWQKFVGHELELSEPHGRARPTVMDATVDQIDGYRFVYCLPFADDRMFVEDTYYSDTPDIDAVTLDRRIADYAMAQGWKAARVARVERGALPVIWGGDFAAYWLSGGKGVAKAGMRAGLCHPLTGYTLPDAVRTAAAIANARDFSGAALHDLTHALAGTTWKARGFYRALTAMLFRAAEPAERWRVLERFYRLDAGLIGRFYAGQSTMFDKARVLAGKPPVPIGRAVAALREIRV